MSLTLGEKLRQAREERGYTISEVAEQTRISSLYLESIERDDYKILPGGIFNKGFVKSFAKFVGVDEQEALIDYSHLISNAETGKEEELKVYKPEVLTDDRSLGSMVPTVIIAVVILAAMTGGVLFLLNYLQQRQDDPVAVAPPKANTNTNANTETPVSTPTETVPSNPPDMATLKVEFKALSEPVSLTATNDGKMSSNIVTPGSVVAFDPKESLKLSYSKSLANVVQLTINGKTIGLPAQPLMPRRNSIEFEINKENLAQIWTSGTISSEVPAAAPDVNVNAAPMTTGTPPPMVPPSVTAPARTPVPKPTVAANTAANTKSVANTNPGTMTGKPVTTPKTQ